MVFFWLLYVCSSSASTLSAVDISQADRGLVLIDVADVYEDSSRTLTIADILLIPQEQWQRLTSGKTAYPITDSRFWIRVNLSNQYADPVVVVLQHPTAFINQLVLYDENGQELSRSSGQVNLDQRAVYDFLPAVKTELAAGQQGTFYILISQFYAEPMIASLRLYSEDVHQAQVIGGLFRDGFIMATLMAFAAIVLLLALILRRSRLFMFVLYLTCLVITIGYYTGISRWLFPVEVPSRFEPVFPFFYLLAIIFLTEFSIRHLSLRRNHPAMFRVYRVLSWAFLLCAVAIVGGVPNSIAIFFGIPLFFMPSLFAAVGWWIYLQKQRETYLLLYSCGLTIYAIGMVVLGFFIFSGHPFAMEMHHQGLLVAYSFISLDAILLIASIGIWLNKQKHYRQVAEAEAQQDPLTGLLNRRGYERKADQLLHEKPITPIWVATLDLDHFKHINDAYSHAVGDEVLVRVAQLLKRLSREPQLVARFGGEEFVLIFHSDSQAGAIHYMNRLRRKVSEMRVFHDDTDIHITVSIGLAKLAGPDWSSLKDALHRSDQALYQAKQGGRDRVVLFDDPAQHSSEVL